MSDFPVVFSKEEVPDEDLSGEESVCEHWDLGIGDVGTFDFRNWGVG